MRPWDVLDKAIQLRRDDAGLWCQRGEIFVQLARLDQALQSFQQALKLNPHHHDALYKSGILLHKPRNGTKRHWRSLISATGCFRTTLRRCGPALGFATA